uniref:Uncharacterized protein n=1 Tax=Helianthus annuus TaxID=4232 RepID=A0A251UWG3_HELAN
MSSIHNTSVETVNAAATAIVSAETRLQPTSVQAKSPDRQADKPKGIHGERVCSKVSGTQEKG